MVDSTTDGSFAILDHSSEENQQHLDESPPKRQKVMETPPRNHRAFGEELDANTDTTPGNLSLAWVKSSVISGLTEVESLSDCGTEVSSVANLRNWLDDFGKHNRSHFDKNTKKPEPTSLTKPTRTKTQPASAPSAPPTPLPKQAANILVKRMVNPRTTTQTEVRRLPKTPVIRIKPKIDNTEVQATNEGYASVKKLSQWLADDPTSKKNKVKQLRRGANVIAKSRAFDKGLANVVIEQNNIRTGSVSDKKQWLANAFAHSDDDSSQSSAVKRDFGNMRCTDEMSSVASSEINLRTDKKAQSEINVRSDEAGDRAKKLWRQRSPPPRRNGSPQEMCVSEDISVATDNSHTSSENVDHSCRRSSYVQARVTFEKSREMKKPENEEKPLDFHAARRLIVERSKQNGNAVDVINKVNRQKAKFEQMQKDARRMSAPFGLLKSTWSSDSEGHGPANSYVKKYVSDAAPKKSFEDLP